MEVCQGHIISDNTANRWACNVKNTDFWKTGRNNLGKCNSKPMARQCSSPRNVCNVKSLANECSTNQVGTQQSDHRNEHCEKST